jgi:hypothetical protein
MYCPWPGAVSSRTRAKGPRGRVRVGRLRSCQVQTDMFRRTRPAGGRGTSYMAATSLGRSRDKTHGRSVSGQHMNHPDLSLVSDPACLPACLPAPGEACGTQMGCAPSTRGREARSESIWILDRRAGWRMRYDAAAGGAFALRMMSLFVLLLGYVSCTNRHALTPNNTHQATPTSPTSPHRHTSHIASYLATASSRASFRVLTLTVLTSPARRIRIRIRPVSRAKDLSRSRPPGFPLLAN